MHECVLFDRKPNIWVNSTSKEKSTLIKIDAEILRLETRCIRNWKSRREERGKISNLMMGFHLFDDFPLRDLRLVPAFCRWIEKSSPLRRPLALVGRARGQRTGRVGVVRINRLHIVDLTKHDGINGPDDEIYFWWACLQSSDLS